MTDATAPITQDVMTLPRKLPEGELRGIRLQETVDAVRVQCRPAAPRPDEPPFLPALTTTSRDARVSAGVAADGPPVCNGHPSRTAALGRSTTRGES